MDQEHEKIKQGDTDLTPDALFQLKIIQPLRKLLLFCPRLRIILVPSVQDIISKHAVYPQAEMESRFSSGEKVSGSRECPCVSCTQPPQRIHFFPNPTLFSVNGVSFGTCSVDVLSHMGQNLWRFSCFDEKLKTSILCRHLLEQRR